MAINVNSLIPNVERLTLQKFLDQHAHDILLLNKMRFNDNCEILEFKNYNFKCQDRSESIQGGGSAVLRKRHINYTRIELKTPSKGNLLEACAIRVKINNGQNIVVISLHASNSNRASFITELNGLFEQLETLYLDNSLILAGDLNARSIAWGDHAHSDRGFTRRINQPFRN